MTLVEIITRNSADRVLVRQVEQGLWRAESESDRSVVAHGITPESALRKVRALLDASVASVA